MADSQNLEDMKLPEPKELAKQMGLCGMSTMCKSGLLATLRVACNGGKPLAGVTVRIPKAAKTAKVVKAPQSDAAEVNITDNTDVAARSPVPVPAATEPQLDLPLPVADGAKKDETESRRTHRKAADNVAPEPRTTCRRRDDDQPDSARRKSHKKTSEAGDLLATFDLGDATPTERRRECHEDAGALLTRRVHDGEDRQSRRHRHIAENSEGIVCDLDDILTTLPAQKHEETPGDGKQSSDHEFVRHSRRDHSDCNDRDTRNDRSDRRNRRMRGRDRDNADDDRCYDDHDNRSDHNNRDSHRGESQEGLMPVAGIVDVLDSYAFMRTSGYLPGPDDVYVFMSQVKKYGLREGDVVHSSIRAPREGDRRNQRQKLVPLQTIDSINDQSIKEALNHSQLSKFMPLYPQECLKQETAPNKLTGRIVDIVPPTDKGQRGLIVSPPKTGKITILRNIANSVTANNPEVHLMAMLVDEQPEEVADTERTVRDEVISSTFDRPAPDHTTVIELAVEHAKRLVELGQDMVALLDSMARLAHAYNTAVPASGRIPLGGVDAQAPYPPKEFFGAARSIENGGSLIIIPSALVETGSKMGEVIFGGFKGTGNMELRLSRELADRRLFLAIDISASSTRYKELITNPQELPVIYRLCRLPGGMEPEQTYQTLVPRLKKVATNRDFLAAIVQQASTGNMVNGN